MVTDLTMLALFFSFVKDFWGSDLEKKLYTVK